MPAPVAGAVPRTSCAGIDPMRKGERNEHRSPARATIRLVALRADAGRAGRGVAVRTRPEEVVLDAVRHVLGGALDVVIAARPTTTRARTVDDSSSSAASR